MEQELFEACKEGNLTEVKSLIKKGADIHNNEDWVFRNACFKGDLEVVKFLVDQGADIHTQDDFAICWASKNGHLEIVKILVDQGADIHTRDDFPITYASKNGHLEIVKFLVENSTDNYDDYYYAIEYASFNNHWNVVRYLESLVSEQENTFSKIQDNMVFLNNKECPITHEILTEEIEKIGCSKCKNLFSKKALETWIYDFNKGSKCPFRCENPVFYEI